MDSHVYSPGLNGIYHPGFVWAFKRSWFREVSAYSFMYSSQYKIHTLLYGTNDVFNLILIFVFANFKRQIGGLFDLCIAGGGDTYNVAAMMRKPLDQSITVDAFTPAYAEYNSKITRDALITNLNGSGE